MRGYATIYVDQHNARNSRAVRAKEVRRFESYVLTRRMSARSRLPLDRCMPPRDKRCMSQS